MREIPLTNGGVALVDDEDFPSLSAYRWRRDRTGYARRSEWVVDKAVTIIMHRVIVDAPAGLVVDHKNHDRCDNRRSNLRTCTPAENSRNRLKHRHSQNAFKGIQVDRSRAQPRYRARLRLHGKAIRGRWVGTDIDAAREYDSIARLHCGEFALLNFPAESA